MKVLYTEQHSTQTVETKFITMNKVYDLRDDSILSKVLRRILNWLGCSIYVHAEHLENRTYNTHTFDLSKYESFSDIYEAALGVYERTGRMPQYVLVGYEQQKRIFKTTVQDTFSVNLDLHRSENGKSKVYGLTVVLIPWMDGILPMLSLDDLYLTRW